MFIKTQGILKNRSFKTVIPNSLFFFLRKIKIMLTLRQKFNKQDQYYIYKVVLYINLQVIKCIDHFCVRNRKELKKCCQTKIEKNFFILLLILGIGCTGNKQFKIF